MSNVRVFTQVNMQRINVQNQVLRHLRAMGCKVLNTALDSRLTIEVAPTASSTLLRGAKCSVRQRVGGGGTTVVSVELYGCLVKWMETTECA
jgi:hypothetical protein